jgi:membrane-associated protease RseP (regulator of RpoE activity)
MIRRNIIVLLTIAAVVGTVASTGMAGADPADDAAGRTDSSETAMPEGKGRLGVAILELGPELRAHFGAPADRGVLIDLVKPDSPAARAGIRVGDLIVEVDGDAAASATGILDAIGDRKKGESVTIVAIRGGKRQELRATLEDDPGSAGPRGRRTGRGGPGALDPDRRRWLEDAPSFGGFDPGTRRLLDDARKRIEQLERRLERLERR